MPWKKRRSAPTGRECWSSHHPNPDLAVADIETDDASSPSAVMPVATAAARPPSRWRDDGRATDHGFFDCPKAWSKSATESTPGHSPPESAPQTLTSWLPTGR